jgi:hypothetical protein
MLTQETLVYLHRMSEEVVGRDAHFPAVQHGSSQRKRSLFFVRARAWSKKSPIVGENAE